MIFSQNFMNKEFKKALLSTLFGSGGVMSKADFRLAIATIVDELVAFKKEITAYVRSIKNGTDGHTPTDEELRILILPLISKPKDGKPPTSKELLALIRPLIPEIKDERLLKLITPLIPESIEGEEIIEKINKDKSDKIIRKEKIEGWEEIEESVRVTRANVGSFLHFSGSTILAQDISASLNGVLKIFTLVPNARVLLVITSSFPTILRPTVDYTTTASSITFTSEIDAGSTLATGQSIMILYKLP